MRISLPQLYFRIAAGAGFFWFGLDRLGAWGPYGKPWVSWGNWHQFSLRAHQLMYFLPSGLAETFAMIATFIEAVGGFLLLIGLFTRYAAYACSMMTFFFGLAMAITDGITSPMGYSVFSLSAACWLLAIQPSYRWSLDALIRPTPMQQAPASREHRQNQAYHQ